MVDEQLLITVVFKERVNCVGFQVFAPNNEKCPNNLKLFLNNDQLAFDDVLDGIPVETIELKNLKEV